MSMDLYVLVDHPSRLTVIEWQQAIDAAHYSVRLSESIDLRKLDGFLPVTLNTRGPGSILQTSRPTATFPARNGTEARRPMTLVSAAISSKARVRTTWPRPWSPPLTVARLIPNPDSG
jgi:hypothetical protein